MQGKKSFLNFMNIDNVLHHIFNIDANMTDHEILEALLALSDTVAKVAVAQKNIVLPRMEALAEGQDTILQKLIPRSRFDQMQAE